METSKPNKNKTSSVLDKNVSFTEPLTFKKDPVFYAFQCLTYLAFVCKDNLNKDGYK